MSLKEKIEACIEDMTPEVAKAYLINILTERRYKGMTPSELIDAEYGAMVKTKECLEKDRPVDAMDRMWEEDRKEIGALRQVQEAKRVVADMMG